MRSNDRTTRACDTESSGVFLTSSVNSNKYRGGLCIGMIAMSRTERALCGAGEDVENVVVEDGRNVPEDFAAAPGDVPSLNCLLLTSNELVEEASFFVNVCGRDAAAAIDRLVAVANPHGEVGRELLVGAPEEAFGPDAVLAPPLPLVFFEDDTSLGRVGLVLRTSWPGSLP